MRLPISLASTSMSIEERIEYHFTDQSLLSQALTYSILLKPVAFKKLAFLGDAVIGIVVADWVNTTSLDVGPMTVLRQKYISNRYLAERARAIDLGQHKAIQGYELLADALEALIGAVYKDGGLDSARRVIHSIILIDAPEEVPNNPKTRLNNWAMKIGLRPSYEHVKSQHEFMCRLHVGGYTAEAGGTSKKMAEMSSAAKVLVQIE